MATVKAIILLGHGSRDPLWRQPMEAVAHRIRQAQPLIPVRSAFLELEEPDFGTAAAELVALGIQQITIAPLFLGTGRHAREDLPRLLAQARLRHPQVEFVMQATVGENSDLLDLLAKIALA